MQLRLSLLLGYICFVLVGSGQPGFLSYTVKNGLSQNAVTAIFRDSKGYVWLGTQDGLNRFDGIGFVKYKHDSNDTLTISDQYITAISEDGAGNIWVGTRNGLNKFSYTNNSFERIHINPNRKNVIQYVFEQMFQLGNGDLVFVAEDQLYLWNYKKRLIKKMLGNFNQRSAFTVNGAGIWRLYGSKLWHYDSRSFQLKKIYDVPGLKKAQSVVSKIIFDRKEKLWIIDETVEHKPIVKILKMDGRLLVSDSFLLPEKIYHLSFDPSNRAWFSSLSGLLQADSTRRPYYWRGAQLPYTLNQSNAILCSYHDATGISWIGFANNGFLIFNQTANAFKLIQPMEKPETVFGFALDSNNHEWLAAISGIYKKERTANKWKLVSKRKVRWLVAGEKGKLWAAIENEGLFLIHPDGQFQLIANTDNTKLPDNTIFHLHYQPRTQQLFISTKSGLVLMDTRTLLTKRYWAESVNNQYQLSGSYVLHSFTDREQRTWVSSNTGIDVFDKNGKRILQYKTNDDKASPIKRTIVTGTTQDSKGNIWIATLSNGVYKWTNGKFQQYNQANGLSGNVVAGIMADSLNRLWVATTTGMNLIDPDKGQIFQLSEQNGMPASDFLLSSFFYHKSGALLAGSSEGLVMIWPDQFTPTNALLNCYVSDAAINFNPVRIADRFQLQSDDKSISIEIASPSFINAEKVIYQYRFLGLVDKWVTLQPNNRRISFTNLPYKTFQLEIRAAESIALLSRAPVKKVLISRKPPFWQNPVFVAPAIVISLIGLLMLIRFFTRRKIRQQMQQSEIEQRIYKERERISRDLHDHLGAYAAAIKSNINQLERKDEQTGNTLQKLKENADDMVNALRETIWVLQYQEISITALSDRFKNLVNRIRPNYPGVSIEVSENIEADKHLTPAESIHLLRMMQEVLTNALKHADCSKINIRIQVNQLAEIEIEDDGKGFEMEEVNSGFGLGNLNERASESGASLQIFSQKGAGTRIRIVF